MRDANRRYAREEGAAGYKRPVAPLLTWAARPGRLTVPHNSSLVRGTWKTTVIVN